MADESIETKKETIWSAKQYHESTILFRKFQEFSENENDFPTIIKNSIKNTATLSFSHGHRITVSMHDDCEFSKTSKEHPQRGSIIPKRIIPSTGMGNSSEINDNKDSYSVKTTISQQRRNRLVNSNSDSSILAIHPVFPKKTQKGTSVSLSNKRKRQNNSGVFEDSLIPSEKVAKEIEIVVRVKRTQVWKYDALWVRNIHSR